MVVAWWLNLERERERERERSDVLWLWWRAVVMSCGCGGASDPCCCNGSCIVVTDLDGFIFIFYLFMVELWCLVGLRGAVGVAWVSCGV